MRPSERNKSTQMAELFLSDGLTFQACISLSLCHTAYLMSMDFHFSGPKISLLFQIDAYHLLLFKLLYRSASLQYLLFRCGYVYNPSN